MSAPSETVSATPTHQMPFAGHNHARMKIVNVASYCFNDSGKFVSNRHWCRNRTLRPGVPFINVHVSTANRGTKSSDQHIELADFRDWNFFQAQSRSSFFLHQCLHSFH